MARIDMKPINFGCGAVIVAMLSGGCGAGPADQASADETASENSESLMQAAVTPTKGPPPRMMSNGTFTSQAFGFSYAGGGLPAPAQGGLPNNVFQVLGRVTIAKPDVRRSTNDPAGAHSLAEISAQDAQQLEGVEIGWIVYDDDPNPRLFVFYWSGGNYKCIQNTVPPTPHYKCTNFVSTSTTIKPDMVLPVGATVDLSIKRVDSGTTAGWHFLYNGTDFGYIPGGALSPQFTSISIAEWFGEVAGSTGTRCSAMGNGRFGTDPLADSFATLQYTVRGQSPINARMNLISPTEPSKYNAAFGGTQYVAPIRFGGPYYASSPVCPPLPNPCKKKTCCSGAVTICETQSCPIICPPPEQ
jgi:hypothetical protein